MEGDRNSSFGSFSGSSFEHVGLSISEYGSLARLSNSQFGSQVQLINSQFGQNEEQKMADRRLWMECLDYVGRLEVGNGMENIFFKSEFLIKINFFLIK